LDLNSISKQVIKRYLLFIFLLLGTTCTSSRWIVEDSYVADQSTAKILEKSLIVNFNSITNNPNPILNFSLKEVNKTKFQQKILTRRYIQQYRPRWMWFIAGLGISGSMFYYANFMDLNGAESNQTAQILLNIASTGVFVGNFYLQKPVGEPLRTEETRLLSNTGTVVKNDTIPAISRADENVKVNIYYKNQLWLFNKEFSIKDSKIEIDLFRYIQINPLKLEGDEQIIADVEYSGSFQEFFIPLNTFLVPYVSLKKTGIVYNKPSDSRQDQITSAQERTIYPLQSEELAGWYRVQFGPTTAFVEKSKAEVVWAQPGLAPEKFVTADQKVAGIGNLDNIEIEIPLETRRPRNPRALLIGNRRNDAISSRDDLRAFKSYLIQTFGYETDEIVNTNQLSFDEFKTIIRNFRDSGPHQEITIFYSGNFDDSSEPMLQFFNKSSVNSIPLKTFLNQLSLARGVNYRVIIEAPFSAIQLSSMVLKDKIDREVQVFLSGNDKSFVWFSTNPGQSSAPLLFNQSNEDFTYSAFNYNLLAALKNGLRTHVDIKSYLDRELNFISRKDFNRSQESLLYVKKSFNLLE